MNSYAPRSTEELLFLELLAAGHCAKMRAGGQSMTPWIWPNSCVEIEPTPASVDVGDVLLARIGGALALHRVIENRADGTLLLKGDRLPSPDLPVVPEQILGRLIFVERGWPRYPTQPLGRWFGRLIALISKVHWKAQRRVGSAFG